ncbi:MAG: signal peptide peptidase SppA [Chitinispirillales bacterium]|nr:signal peptide peptidase SppA [Chitinispirillales bacterium]
MNSKTHKWIIIGIFAFTVIAGLLFIAVVLGLGTIDSAALPFRRVAVVRIEGVIMDSDWHTSVLRSHLDNRNVAGVLLRIDSPGGAVVPAQEIYNIVAEYKAAGKPLVVSMGHVAASGGYYIASPASKIFASPGTLTGSIGVIFTLPMYQELAKKVGIDFRVLKSGEFKDAGSPYRPMEEDEKQLFQEMLDDVYEQFITDVAIGRNMDIEEVRVLADGMVYTGKQALEKNMVDALGGFAEAMSYLKEITGVSETIKPLEKRRNVSWWDLMMESAGKHLPLSGAGALGRPVGVYYLFVP